MGEPGGQRSHGCEHHRERADGGSKCGDCLSPTLTSPYPDNLAGVSLGPSQDIEGSPQSLREAFSDPGGKGGQGCPRAERTALRVLAPHQPRCSNITLVPTGQGGSAAPALGGDRSTRRVVPRPAA